MLPAPDTIDSCIRDVDQARTRVSRAPSKQVTKPDERDYLKSVAYAWFRSHRTSLDAVAADEVLQPVDAEMRTILEATARHSARSTYLGALQRAKQALTSLRSASLVPRRPTTLTAESPPDFSALASDAAMKAILERRWRECQLCIQVKAHLAATVMMGGVLEALFVARANLMRDKGPLFRAKGTPVDPKTKKPIPLADWTLRPYIDVAADIGWISRSGKDVAAILRDYRNYVHPEKERSHGVVLNEHDTAMFWEVTKSLAGQLLSSVK